MGDGLPSFISQLETVALSKMGDMERDGAEPPAPVIHRRASRTPSIADIQEIPILNASSSQKFSRLPQKEPVDMKFENLHYNVSLGYRKGK